MIDVDIITDSLDWETNFDTFNEDDYELFE